MFYPAEPDALNALIADVRRRARPDGGVAPKVVVAPHAGLVYSGSVAATAFGPWARRAEPPRRIVIVGPAHRVAFSGVAVHPASKWRTPLGEAPVAPVAHAELAQAPGVVVDPRPFAGEHSLEMHLVMLQAMLPAPFEIVPILVGDADPPRSPRRCAGSGADRRRLSRSPPTCRIFSTKEARESIDSDTARRIETLDAAALDGRRACGFLAVKAALEIAAERDMRASGLHLATSADAGADASRVVGYGAFALEYAASARLAEADRERLLSACMTALGVAAQTSGKSAGAEPSTACRPRFRRGARPSSRSPKTSGFAAASVRLSPVGRSSRMRSPTRRRRALPTRAFRRSRSPNSRGFASTSRFSPTRGRSRRKASPNSRARSSPTATGSFSRPAGAAPCSCRASGATSPTRARSCAI